MRKRYLLIIVIALFCALCGFTACGEHQHTSSQGWQYSAEEHYKVCDKCHERFDVSEHSAEEWESDDSSHYKKCEVCGIDFAEGAHTLGNWQVDQTSHWKACSVCNQKVEVNTHRSAGWQVDEVSQTHFQVCLDCTGRYGEGGHDSEEWVTDGTNHWKVCNTCKLEFDKGAHEQEWVTDEEEHWQLCTVCDLTSNKGAHEKSEQWQLDDLSHWKACDVCEARLDEASHTANGWNKDDNNHSQTCTVCENKYNQGMHSASVYRADKDNHWKTCVMCDFEYAKGAHTSQTICPTCDQDFVGTPGLSYRAIKDTNGDIKGYAVGAGKDLMHQPVEGYEDTVTEISIPLLHDELPVLCVGLTYDEWYEIWQTETRTQEEADLETAEMTFAAISSLSKIRLPASMTELGVFALSSTSILDLKLPDTIEVIREQACYGCAVLRSVTMSKELKTIEGAAFAACPSLNCELKFYNNMESILSDAFTLSAITKIDFGTSIKSIGTSAFFNCPYLEELAIPDSVIELGSDVFNNCVSLKSVKIGSGVTELPVQLFAACIELTKITIPAQVKTIGANAFGGCTKLKSITFEDPTGWRAGSTTIKESELRSSTSAAKYLTKTYCDANITWTKS